MDSHPVIHRLGAAARCICWNALLCVVVALASLGGPGIVGTNVAAQAPQAEAALEGTLEVQYEDFDGGSRLNYFLTTDAGQRFRLQFLSDPPGLPTGTRVRARGQLSNGTLMLTSGTGVTTVALASPNTFGEQKTIVILVNFQDNPVEPYTTGSAKSVTFAQTSNFYVENSYGQTSLVGDVTPWFTIALDSTTWKCAYSTLASLAEQAATNAGYSVASYPRRIYAFPSSSACGWWGLGTVGGNPSQAWINGTYSIRVVAHEFGHNLGDWHSHSEACSSGGCTVYEYGDDHDIMGATVGHLNPYQKERLGYLKYGSSPDILDVAQNSQQWLEPYETPSGGFPKALKILYKSTSSKTYLYAEARTQWGFDSSLSPGVFIHTGNDANGDSSMEKDLAATSTTTDLKLDPGQSVTFTDGIQPITLTTLSADNSGALIDVVFGPVPCVTRTPTVSVSPSATQWGPTGSTEDYTVTVTNNDSVGCDKSLFTFSAASTLPSGWAAAFDVASATTQPGGSGSTGAHITSAANTPAGQYTVTFSAVNGNSTLAGSASVLEWVAQRLDVDISVSPSNPTRQSWISVTATVHIGQLTAVPGAKVVVTVRQPVPADGTSTYSGTTASNGTVTVKFRLNKAKDPAGTYQIIVDANKDGILGTNTTNINVQ